MNEKYGTVIEVFIPNEYKKGNLLDVMDSTHVGFQVMTEDGIKSVIVEANEFNAQIMKNDFVRIIEQNICGTHYIDIELYEGEDYE